MILFNGSAQYRLIQSNLHLNLLVDHTKFLYLHLLQLPPSPRLLHLIASYRYLYPSLLVQQLLTFNILYDPQHFSNSSSFNLLNVCYQLHTCNMFSFINFLCIQNNSRIYLCAQVIIMLPYLHENIIYAYEEQDFYQNIKILLSKLCLFILNNLYYQSFLLYWLLYPLLYNKNNYYNVYKYYSIN